MNLARQIAVSFEDGLIRIVYASLKRGSLVVKKTLVLRDEDLDDFLKKEKSGSFTLICDFKAFYQEVLFLPPVKKKYLKNIIETEIRKRSPELKDFSFFYTILGEKIYEGKKMMETFVFAVENYDLNSIVSRFGKYGKQINGLYPAAFTLSRLMNLSYGITDEPVICVAETETGKTIFYVKGGNLNFIRSIQSMESGISDIDVQNINMTINYCRQELRLSPERIVLIGTTCSKCERTMDLALPVVCAQPPSNVIASREAMMEFIIPISAILTIKDMEGGNLLPQDYMIFYRQKDILTYYTAFFLLFFVIGIGYLKMKFTEIATTKEKINALRSEISEMVSIRVNYENKKRELDKFMPLINFINAANSSPDMQKALVVLSALKKPGMKDINISIIDINPEGNAVRIRIKGNVTAKHLTYMQQTYQDFIGSIKSTKGMELVSDKIDLKDMGFQIEARYSAAYSSVLVGN